MLTPGELRRVTLSARDERKREEEQKRLEEIRRRMEVSEQAAKTAIDLAPARMEEAAAAGKDWATIFQELETPGYIPAILAVQKWAKDLGFKTEIKDYRSGLNNQMQRTLIVRW